MRKNAIRLLALLLAVMMLTACAPTPETPSDDPPAGGGSSNPSEPPAGTCDGLIYYNVERGAERTPTPSGYYSVKLAGNEKTFSFLVTTKAVMDKIDTMDVMSLVFDDKGLVCDAQSIDALEATAVAGKLTVQAVDGTKISVKDEAGTASELTAAADMKAFLIAEESAEATTLEADDVIIAVQNKAGEVIRAFVVTRITEAFICPHCDQIVEWIAWVSNSTLPAEKETGHYYLTNDIILSAQQSIRQDNQIVLDLNGKTVTGGVGKRIYALFETGTYLAILDSSEEQTGKMVAVGSGMDEGNLVWLRYGKFDFYSGTLDASQATSKKAGTAIRVRANTEFNMYGGTIIGGNAAGAEPFAGSISVYGLMNMFGGVIRDGHAEDFGGNMVVRGGGVFNMSGGTITGGTAVNGSPNIDVASDSTFNQTGGTVG